LKLSYHLRSLILNKTIDILIVIVGITIAFQLSNIKERYDQRSLENFYIENLNNDIDKDINSINYLLKELRADSSLTKKCINEFSQKSLSLDALGNAIINILSFETFSYRNDNTYNILMNSNGLSIISNRETRNLISEYYKTYKSVDRFEYVYTEFLLKDFHPYFDPNVDYSTGKILNPSILSDVRTNNRLLITEFQINDGIETYTHMLSRASELRKVLTEL